MTTTTTLTPADVMAMEVVGEGTLRLCCELIDGVVLVSLIAKCASIKVIIIFLHMEC